MNAPKVTIETDVKAPLDKVWTYWTEPEHITQWNSASEDWHTPRATNDLKVGGRFTARMEAKDGSMGFDFAGTYTRVEPMKHIAYTMDDGRNVTVEFTEEGERVRVQETFDPESENPIDMQRDGWQAILDNFKKHVEEN
jgi:uncharacterized protein YndB with AHSA1/START domain